MIRFCHVLKKAVRRQTIIMVLLLLVSYIPLFAQTSWICATDSAVWKPRYFHTSVVFDDRMWVLKGFPGELLHDIYHSTDGTNWVKAVDSAFFPMHSSFTCLSYNDRMWVFGGDEQVC